MRAKRYINSKRQRAANRVTAAGIISQVRAVKAMRSTKGGGSEWLASIPGITELRRTHSLCRV